MQLSKKIRMLCYLPSEREVCGVLASPECIHHDLRDEESDGDSDRDLDHTNAKLETAGVAYRGVGVVLDEATASTDSGLYIGGQHSHSTVHVIRPTHRDEEQDSSDHGRECGSSDDPGIDVTAQANDKGSEGGDHGTSTGDMNARQAVGSVCNAREGDHDRKLNAPDGLQICN